MEIIDQINSAQWVIFGAFLATLLPLIVGYWRFSRLDPALRYLLFFCTSGFALDLVSRVMWMMKTQNLVLGHLNTLIEFLLLASAYRYTLDQFAPRWAVKSIMIAFAILAIGNTVFLQSINQNNSYIKILESLLLISFSLAYFYKLAKEMKVEHLERHPFFWINTGVLIYFSSNLFVFTYSNYLLLYSQELGIRIWFVHALFFIFFNCILALGLWIVPKNLNSPG